MDSGGQRDGRVFDSRDQGWGFYEDMMKSRHTYTVTFEHTPAQ